MGILNGIQKFLHTLKTTKNVEVGQDLDVVGDAAIGGELTVTGNLRSNNNAYIADGKFLAFNNSSHGVILPSTTFDQALWGIGAGFGRQLVLCDAAHAGKDFDHAEWT